METLIMSIHRLLFIIICFTGFDNKNVTSISNLFCFLYAGTDINCVFLYLSDISRIGCTPKYKKDIQWMQNKVILIVNAGLSLCIKSSYEGF